MEPIHEKSTEVRTLQQRQNINDFCIKGVRESQWSVVKMVKTDFIQELLQWGLRDLRLKYSISKWGFISKEQGEGQWMENY